MMKKAELLDTGKKPETKKPKSKKNLELLRDHIKQEIPRLDTHEYSDVIINCTLRNIAAHYGKAEANKAVEELGLDKLGWKKEL